VLRHILQGFLVAAHHPSPCQQAWVLLQRLALLLLALALRASWQLPPEQCEGQAEQVLAVLGWLVLLLAGQQQEMPMAPECQADLHVLSRQPLLLLPQLLLLLLECLLAPLMLLPLLLFLAYCLMLLVLWSCVRVGLP
jgi:hypothetical protein